MNDLLFLKIETTTSSTISSLKINSPKWSVCDFSFSRFFSFFRFKKEDVFLIAFGPETLIIEIAPIPGGDEIATISSLNSITYKLLVKVALLLCNVLS